MEKAAQEADARCYSQPLSPPSEFLASCPQFRILVLGNPESTKQEIFSKVFGVDLDKVSLVLCPFRTIVTVHGGNLVDSKFYACR